MIYLYIFVDTVVHYYFKFVYMVVVSCVYGTCYSQYLRLHVYDVYDYPIIRQFLTPFVF